MRQLGVWSSGLQEESDEETPQSDRTTPQEEEVRKTERVLEFLWLALALYVLWFMSVLTLPIRRLMGWK